MTIYEKLALTEFACFWFGAAVTLLGDSIDEYALAIVGTFFLVGSVLAGFVTSIARIWN